MCTVQRFVVVLASSYLHPQVFWLQACAPKVHMWRCVTMGVLWSYCLDGGRNRLLNNDENTASWRDGGNDSDGDSEGRARPEVTLPPIQLFWRPMPGQFLPSDWTMPFDTDDLADADLYGSR